MRFNLEKFFNVDNNIENTDSDSSKSNNSDNEDIHIENSSPTEGISKPNKEITFKKKENFFHNKNMMIWFIFLAVVIIFLLFGRSDNVVIIKS